GCHRGVPEGRDVHRHLELQFLETGPSPDVDWDRRWTRRVSPHLLQVHVRGTCRDKPRTGRVTADEAASVDVACPTARRNNSGGRVPPGRRLEQPCLASV